MTAKSRNKGAAGEREIAKELYRELGINFKRDLTQYQTGERGDLICEDDGFPFLIEVKRRASGWTCSPEWEAQAFRAAQSAKKHPAVAYRFDGKKWRVRVYLDAVSEAVGNMVPTTTWLETDVQGFAWIARELMARRAA